MRIVISLLTLLALFIITASEVKAQYVGDSSSSTDGTFDSCYGNCGTTGISGFTYIDNDSSGTFNSGDIAFPGQTIRLLSSTGTVVATRTTTSAGYYDFNTITPGTYQVHFKIEPTATGYTRINPTTDAVTLTVNSGVERRQNFGVRGPYFTQELPVPSCVGQNSNIRLSWSASNGAGNYEVLYLNSAGQLIDRNIFTAGARNIDLGTSHGLVPGSIYSFIIVAYAGGAPLAYSDNQRWSHQKFAAYTTFPVCGSTLPPGNFTLACPTTSCVGTSPRINVAWNAAPNLGTGDYTLKYRIQGTPGEPIAAGPTTLRSYIFGQSAVPPRNAVIPVTPGGRYGFIVLARNSAGSVYSNGNWSDTPSICGPTIAPSCGSSTSPPTLTLSGSPLSITAGQYSTLTWTATNVTTCTASNGWSGSRNATGSQAVFPSATATYVLSCTGPGGSVSRQVTVNVTASPSAPTLTFTGSPLSITAGQYSTLTWTTTNATSCTASNAWNGVISPSGNHNVYPGSTSTYDLICSGPGGSVSKQVTITVSPTTPPPPTDPPPTDPPPGPGPAILLNINGQVNGDPPLNVNQNQVATLTWTSPSATGCPSATVTTNDGTPVPGDLAADWNGSKPVTGGPVNLSTASVGTFFINLTCTNGTPTTASIQMNILKFPRPFFQTTGGDVHTNETIYISP